MKKNHYKYLVLSVVVLLQSCIKTREVQPNFNADQTDLLEAVIPEEFSYKTTSEVNLILSTLDNQNQPLVGIPLYIYYTLDSTRFQLGQGLTGDEGQLNFSIALPVFVDSIHVETAYIGLPKDIAFAVNEGDNFVSIGGSSAITARKIQSKLKGTNARKMVSSVSYLSNYDDQGVPDNLLPVKDYISQDLLDMINSTLPERYPVPTNNPEYLDSDLIADARILDSAEVWVTFVHEGAGWRNALGYYEYDLSSPPQSAEEIEELHIIFPNVSFPKQGGNLVSGSKVSLGNFSANTGIGWFLLPNAWNGSEVIQKNEVKYSNKDFNTFTDEQYRQHTVLLKDENRQLLLLGMEDTSRPSGDNDFNDAVFYISANPFEALDTEQLETTKTEGTDSDNDGVADTNDAYPEDGTKAFNIYAPAQDEFGTVAFEDNWPEKGDYDLNDLIVEYNYQMVTNTSNKVTELIGRFKLVATGAEYSNGFGLRLPMPNALISSIITNDPSRAITWESQGDESGDAVFIIFDDAHTTLNATGPVNTIPEKENVEPVEFELHLKFKSPVLMADLGYAPFDPFIFIDGDRSREVHLPDHAPTTQANSRWMGSSNDTSDPSIGRFYKSETNLPWALHVPGSFEYPKEYAAINAAYKKFVDWAESSGKKYKDWYHDKREYRNAGNLYK